MPEASPRKSRLKIKPAAKAAKRAKASATARKRRPARQSRGKSASVVVSPLVAEFARALGEEKGKAVPTTRRRSLKAALQDAQLVSPLAVMPGVQVAPSAQNAPVSSEHGAPCVAYHRKQERASRLHAAGAWCLTVVISAVIVTAATAALMASRSDVPAPKLVRTASVAAAR